MTEEQQFLFDLNGFLIIEDVLTLAECEDLKKQIYLIKFDSEKLPAEHREIPGGHFASLIDHPKVEPILKKILGLNIRLDHGFVIWRKQGERHPADLHHGGPTPEPMFRYHFRGEKMFSGLLRVVFELNDVGPEDGGTCFIPGSHKSNFHVPKSMISLKNEEMSPAIYKSSCKAGSVIIFTENVAHGGPEWNSPDKPRVSVFYSYNHLGMQFHKPIFSPEIINTLTTNQQSYFRNTWIYDFENDQPNGNINYSV
ncbi:MAG: hypothetical protein ACI8ZM_004281 [Crocinitomix sp.]|jgi:hypothetical protein